MGREQVVLAVAEVLQVPADRAETVLDQLADREIIVADLDIAPRSDHQRDAATAGHLNVGILWG